MENKIYKCLCGKEFNDPQKFNGHKRHCSIHLSNKYGNGLNQRQQIIKQKSDETRDVNRQEKAAAKKEKIDLEIQTWISEQHVCEKCGKLMTEKYGSGRFCSSSCAKSRTHSEATKLKIKNSCIKYVQNNQEKVFNTLQKGFLNPEVRKKAIENKKKKKNYNEKRRIKIHKEKAKSITFDTSLIPCVEDEVENRKAGWQTRSIKNSYPEQFWMKVFDNNNIKYIREYKIHNEFSGKKGALYKMDFLIDDKIDIEIDGSQHKLTVEKDLRRDKYLESLGYIVYRIKWINPYNAINSKTVSNQISDLLQFLKKIKE